MEVSPAVQNAAVEAAPILIMAVHPPWHVGVEEIWQAITDIMLARAEAKEVVPMHFENEHIYPDCPTITRTVHVGGLTKLELIQELQSNAISMNEAAERLFASDHFTTSEARSSVTTVELTVRDLGFPRGATIAEISARAAALGLGSCPIELGPHLRLQYLDQPEGSWAKPFRQHQAPYGSITIASEQLTEDDGFPKGFYLRRIEGVLWLRGYCSGAEHIWEPDDHFIFSQI